MNKGKLFMVLKSFLEFGPIIIFFLSYGRIKNRVFSIGGVEYEGFIVATATFIPVLLISIGLLWLLTGNLSRMQVVTAILVIIFGGLSIWFNDERFFKMKPTIIYLIFSGLLVFGLLRQKSYLAYVMESMIPMEPVGWNILTKRVAFFFFSLAVANEIIWRNMSTDTWVNFKTFGITGAVFVFFILQSGLFKRYGVEPQE
ncbi:MAG: septation protein IspZ [Proteobacteria bacterium]|jgi:intracellular septation protein|nr:septation protein IspZ [Pseudomonadota bacterium]MDA1239002.1 septation protein IspZ [Pseudomonadota bacterium]